MSSEDNTYCDQASASAVAAQKRPADSSDADDNATPRIHLACLSCRAKKAKCSGDSPRCQQCRKSDLTCTWPDGRKRKRNKKEMQMANRLACLMSGEDVATAAQQAAVFQTLNTLQHSGFHRFESGLPAWMMMAASQQNVGGFDEVPTHIDSNRTVRDPSSATIDPTTNSTLGMPQPVWDTEMRALANLAQPFDVSPSTQASRGSGGPGPSTMQYLHTNRSEFNLPTLSDDSGQPPRRTSSHVEETNNIGAGPNTSSQDPTKDLYHGEVTSLALDQQPVDDDDSNEETRNGQSAILGAIANQVGYIEGDHGEPYLRVYYYRVSGSTAIHPGINRICLKLQLRQPPTNGGSEAGSNVSPAASALPTALEPIFDPQTDMPTPEVYEPLLELFFEHCSQHFPSVQPKRIYGRIKDGTMSAMLLSAMCAVAARFHPSAKGNLTDAGNAFMKKAYDLTVPNIRLPNTDSVTALLLMSWCEFGQNSESGQWGFSGLAMRMSQDQGFHKNTDVMYEDHAHFVRNKLLFWGTVITDRLLAFSTGRPCSIREDSIELPLPEDEDLPLSIGSSGEVLEALPSPFVQFIKLMMISGRIADLLNGIRGSPRTFPNASIPEDLSALQSELVHFYSHTPEAMAWSASNFKEYIARKLGGIYLTYHCVSNALLASLYHPTILYAPNGADTPISQSLNKSVQLSLASSRLICEAIVFSDLCSPSSLIVSPQISQALYIAGLAFVHEIKQSTFQGSGDPSTSGAAGQGTAFLHLLAKQNLDMIIKALRKLERYWAGAGVARHILEQRASGLGHARIDFSKIADHIPTFVSLPDSGILRRFTGNLGLSGLSPQDQLTTIAALSPGAQNIAHDVNDNSETQLMLQNLMSQYSVDEMFVEDAGSFEPSFFDFDFSM